MVASYLFSEEVMWYFCCLFLKCLKGFPKNCSLFFLLKYNWFTWYLLSYLGHQWSCLGQESPFGENVNCEFKFVDKKFNFLCLFCPFWKFVSIKIFFHFLSYLLAKVIYYIPYCSLTSIQYLMSHLFLILVFLCFSFSLSKLS